MEFVFYTLPIYWASYLVNGDCSGLEDNEIEEIDTFLEREGNPIVTGVGDETWFAVSNDANRLGAEVADYCAIVRDS